MSILHNDGNQTRKVYPSSLSKRNAMAAKESMWAHTGKDKGRVVGPNGPRPESQELRVLLIYTPRWELENQGPCLHHLLASFTWLCTIWGILCLCLSLTTFPCSSWHNLQEIMRWPKYWSFSFRIIPSKEIPGLISFKMDCLDLLAVQGLSRVFSNTTVQKHQFFGAQPASQSNSHIHTWPQEKP